MKKKTWIEPALIVLVRSKPEEAVLGAFKDDSRGGAGMANMSCAWFGCEAHCDEWAPR